MARDYSKYAGDLAQAVQAHVASHGAKLCEEIDHAVGPILLWLDYLRQSQSTGSADDLLDGVRSAVFEVAGCLTLGLVRPAIFSMRAEIDMLLAWLYFRNHPVEWKHIHESGEGYKLKKELFQYLETYVSGFSERFGLLRKCKGRTQDDPYRLLSAHVHSQSPGAIPAIAKLDHLVTPFDTCIECAALQHECAEYFGDLLWACFANQWASIPDELLSSIKKRLGPKERSFFVLEEH